MDWININNFLILLKYLTMFVLSVIIAVKIGIFSGLFAWSFMVLVLDKGTMFQKYKGE